MHDLSILKEMIICQESDNKMNEDQTLSAAAAIVAADVEAAYQRTLGYVDTIRTCYDTKQQITGNQVMTLLQTTTKHPSNCSSNLKCLRGKVRDRYLLVPTNSDADGISTSGNLNSSSSSSTSNRHNKIALVTTDRQSGFDRSLAIVPYKGAVLNLCSNYWFEQTKDIIPNHILSVPHPNVTIAKQCQPFPIEFVVRAYMTGSTSTSIWKNYQNGVRNYCGHILEDGMTKNQKLPNILLTPTTKEEEHDRPISIQEIIDEQWMTKEDLDICSNAALRLFQRGQELAIRHGLILVDTKYEFGYDPILKEILLIDEIHTPDSSRYWIASTYQERVQQQLEPENIDKEFLRLWFMNQPDCDPYNVNIPLPEPPADLVIELSRRYIQLYEMITGKAFQFPTSTRSETENDELIANVIRENLI